MDGRTNQNSFRNPETGVEIRTDGRWLRVVDQPGLSCGPGGDHPLIIRPPTHHSHSHFPISPSHSDLNGNPSALTTLASRGDIGMSTRAGDRNGADPAELGTHVKIHHVTTVGTASRNPHY